MTGNFSEEMKSYFGSSEGAYTEMTQMECDKLTYNVKSAMRNILISNLGYNNIPRAGISDKQCICFNIYGENISM